MQGPQFSDPRVPQLDLNDLHDQHFAHFIATLTMVWGAIDHYLFLLVFYSDQTKGREFTERFFGKIAIPAREKVTKQQVEARLKSKYPEFIPSLQKAFDLYANIRARRNPLVHGFWERDSETIFSITPSVIDKNDPKEIAATIFVNLKYLSDLLRDIHFLIRALASLGSEMLAFTALEAIEEKRQPKPSR